MPDDAIAFNNLALQLLESGDARQAAFAAREAIRRDTRMWQPVHTLALSLDRLQDFHGASACYRHTLTLNPHHPLAQSQLVAALIRDGRSLDALTESEKLLHANPADPVAWCNLGLALRQLRCTGEAIRAYQTGLSHAPQDPLLHWNLSLALLASGQFEQGWREYEWRVAAGISPPTLRDEPLWQGQSLCGKSILLESEQGLGDTIQFLRYAPWLESEGAHVFVDCQLRLRGLCSRWIAREARNYDFRAPIMSLPLLTAGVLPEPKPYLAAPRHDFGDGFHVGLCWAGNAAHSNDRFRSMNIESLQPLLELNGIHWVSLEQKPGDTVEQLAVMLQGLDLVITVDTMVAHLAGALGRPVWNLLCYSPDWRWRDSGVSTDWYPTMRLFRQPQPGDWNSLVHEVRAELQASQSNARPVSSSFAWNV